MKKLLSLFTISSIILSCGGVPNTAARQYIEKNNKEGVVSFISCTDIDSTKHVSTNAIKKMHDIFEKTGNLKSDFPTNAPRTLYYTNIKYIVTHNNGETDTINQTFYMDKEQTVVYAIKNNGV